MHSPNTEALLDADHEELTFEEREARLRIEGREAAQNSVRRIRLEGALRVQNLRNKYAGELAAAAQSARRTTRRMTSGFSIAFLVGAAALLASLVKVPSLTPDVALEGYNQFEVAGLHVAVSSAEAESELAVEPSAGIAPPPPTYRSKPVARSANRPAAKSVDPCTGDPYDPLNFCL